MQAELEVIHKAIARAGRIVVDMLVFRKLLPGRAVDAAAELERAAQRLKALAAERPRNAA